MKKGLLIVLLLAVIASPVFSKTIEKVDEYTISISDTVITTENKTLETLKAEKTRLENELTATQLWNEKIEAALVQMIEDVDSLISEAEGLGVIEKVDDVEEVVEKEIISEEVITK